MKYNFNKIISRQETNALCIEGFKNYLFGQQADLKLPCPESDLIHMWVADMQFKTAPEIINAIKKRVEHGIYGYSSVFDVKYNKAFLAWAKSRYDWDIDQNHLVTSQGIIPALYDLVGYLCKTDEMALALTPSYAFFNYATEYNNVKLLTSDLICEEGKYYMNFEDIENKLKDDKVTLFILCSPHNPTGRIWTDEELTRLGKLCLENNVTIIADEIHCDLIRKGITFTPLAKLFPDTDRIITCMAPSKTFNLAGIMFANIIIPDEVLRTTWHKHHLLFENPFSIAAAQAAYSSGHAWLNELTDYLDNNLDILDKFLKKELPKAKFVTPQATYLAWIDMSAYLPKEDNMTRFFAEKAGVLLEGGHMFVSHGKGYIRVNVALPKSKLKEALNRMAKAIKSERN